jgi:hypothetical protein
MIPIWAKNHKIEKEKKKKRKRKKNTAGSVSLALSLQFPRKVSMIFSLGRFRKTRDFQGSPPQQEATGSHKRRVKLEPTVAHVSNIMHEKAGKSDSTKT